MQLTASIKCKDEIDEHEDGKPQGQILIEDEIDFVLHSDRDPGSLLPKGRLTIAGGSQEQTAIYFSVAIREFYSLHTNLLSSLWLQQGAAGSVRTHTCVQDRGDSNQALRTKCAQHTCVLRAMHCL